MIELIASAIQIVAILVKYFFQAKVEAAEKQKQYEAEMKAVLEQAIKSLSALRENIKNDSKAAASIDDQMDLKRK